MQSFKIAAVLALSACAPLTTSLTVTGPVGAARPPDAPVAAYFEGQTPPPFVEVARIRVDSVVSPEAVLAAAGARARQVGADAIVVDFRWHYHSLPVSIDPAGAPHVPPTPRLNANVVAVRYVHAASR